MSDNTSAKVEEIRERLAVIGATRPWHSIKDNDGEIGAYDDCGEPLPRGPEDVNFIAHAPEDIAFLLDRVKELREERDGARAEIVVLEWERDDAREGVTAWGRARDVAEARRVALQGVVDRLTRENARLEEERDALRAEVERLKAMTQPKETLSCPDCEWSGQEVDLIQKMSGALCPSCSRVLKWTGGLRVSAAEVRPLTIEALRPLMVEGWEMPEPRRGDWRPFARPKRAYLKEAAWFSDSRGWVANIPWPFRPGVTVTADMLRTLGFTVEE